LIKIIKTLGEKGKIGVRNIRREANEEIKKFLKEKKISEDENKLSEKNIQKLTDDNILLVDKILEDKEKEILQI
jgi:ribosome recycling factor